MITTRQLKNAGGTNTGPWQVGVAAARRHATRKKAIAMSNIFGEADAKKSRSVIVVLTHSRNLNCVYCYEHHKGRQSMDLATARGIIDREMGSDDGRKLEIESLC